MSDEKKLEDMIFLIAWWPDIKGNIINIQNFIRNGEAYIPIFSSSEQLKSFMADIKSDKKGVKIDTGLLYSLLKGDEVLILNPQSERPIRLQKTDLAGLGRYKGDVH